MPGLWCGPGSSSGAPSWNPWLSVAVLVVGLAAAGALAAGPVLYRRASALAAALAVAACLAGPAAYSVATAHTGAIPSAGPSSSGGFGGGAPGGRAPWGHHRRPAHRRRLAHRRRRAERRPHRLGTADRWKVRWRRSRSRWGRRRPALRRHRQQGAGGGPARRRLPYGWVAATVGSESAATYQLASGRPVMAIGGFNGTDPYPTPAAFEKDVAAGRIHYFISSGGSGGGGSSTSSDASVITAWVAGHYTATTIGGTTAYDLSTPASSAMSS